MIEFRRVTVDGKNKCKCGRVIGVFVSWRTEYRMKKGKRWGPWTDVNETAMPRVTQRVEKSGL